MGGVRRHFRVDGDLECPRLAANLAGHLYRRRLIDAAHQLPCQDHGATHEKIRQLPGQNLLHPQAAPVNLDVRQRRMAHPLEVLRHHLFAAVVEPEVSLGEASGEDLAMSPSSDTQGLSQDENQLSEQKDFNS